MAKVLLKKSSVTGNAPSDSDLSYGELAINYADGRLYYKNSSNQIKNFVDSDQITALIAAGAAGITDVVQDLSPQLGGELDTNGNNITFPDNDKAVFGTGGDLQIFHDGSNSYIQDVGTGSLVIRGSDMFLRTPTDDNFLVGAGGASVTLYYNNAAKFATATDGVSVTGNIAVSGTVDGRDIATDGTKLDGIETGATADQTITAGSGLTGGGTGDVTLNVGAGFGIKVNADDVAIDSSGLYTYFNHDSFTGFVADEHIAHSSITITAGNGLTGGGTIDSSRTINIGQGTGITVGADAISTNDSEIVHDNLSGFVASEHIDHTTITLTAGVGLNGGGTIDSSRTFNIDSAQLYAYFNHDNFSGFVADEHVAHTDVTITAGNGLTGGGNISASRTLNVGAGHGIKVTADAVAIDSAANVTLGSLTTSGNVVVGGNLQVTGTTTTVNTENLAVQANMIYMNDGESAGSPIAFIDTGWVANSRDSDGYYHAGLFRDHDDNGTFKVFTGYTLEPDASVEINTSHASFRLAPFQAATLLGKYLGADSDIDARLSGGTGITYSSGTISIDSSGLYTLNHDSFTGFVTNEHIDHSTVTLTAGNGLTGGGDISTSRTFNVGAGVGITVNADDIAIDSAGLGTYYSKVISHDSTDGFVANEHIDHTTITLTAGDGLTGGGDISASRTFNVGAGTGVTVSANAVSIGQDVATTASPTFAGLTVDTNTLYVDATNNRVGIGTITPAYPLDVVGDVKLSGALRMGSGQEITWANGDASIIEGAEGNNYSLSFRTYTGSANTTKMHILGNGNVGIGTTSPGTPLDVNGTARATQFRLASTGVIDDATATTTSTSQTSIDAWSTAAYGGAKVVIEAKTGVDRHLTELLVTHDGTTAVATEYGAVYTSGVLASYDVDISGGNVRILATPASATSTNFKVMKTMMFA